MLQGCAFYKNTLGPSGDEVGFDVMQNALNNSVVGGAALVVVFRGVVDIRLKAIGAVKLNGQIFRWSPALVAVGIKVGRMGGC